MAAILCPKCNKQVSGVPEKCPHCGFPIRQAVMNGYKPQTVETSTPIKKTKPKNSVLGILALIFSILGFSFIIGAILAIVDLCKRNGKKKGCSIAALVISVLWLMILVGSGVGGNRSSTPRRVLNTNKTSGSTSSLTESGSGETIFKIGETAEMNDVQVTLKSYKESRGDEWNRPSDGNVYVLAEFEIENNSDDEINVSSMLSFNAYADDYSLNYSVGALMENEESQLDGTIASGKKMRGYIGYEVPEDWKEIEIHFTENVWRNNKFKFIITNR